MHNVEAYSRALKTSQLQLNLDNNVCEPNSVAIMRKIDSVNFFELNVYKVSGVFDKENLSCSMTFVLTLNVGYEGAKRRVSYR